MRQLERMAIVLALVGAGCGSEDGGPGLTGEPPAPRDTDESTTGSTTETNTTSASSEDTGAVECGLDQPCPDDDFCVAPHQAGLLEPAGEFVCRSECIPAGSTSFWCLDDDACCGAATCDARFGLCEGTDESTTGTDTGTSTGDTDASTGGTDASTSDASTSDASTSDASTTDGGETTSDTSSSTG